MNKSCYNYTLVNPAFIYTEIFEKVISKLSGDILYLGETGAALYWLLGCVEKVESITIAGVDSAELDELVNYLDKFDQEGFEQNHFPVIEYLKSIGSLTSEEYCHQLLEKIKEVKNVKDLKKPLFDSIVAIEFMQKVKTKSDYQSRFSDTSSFLKDKGSLYGVDMVFDEKNEDVKKEIYIARNNYISSNENLVKSSAERSGANLENIEIISPTHINHIDQFLFYNIVKNG